MGIMTVGIPYRYFSCVCQYYCGLLTRNVTRILSQLQIAFSALLVGQQEGHLVCKNGMLMYWHGYLSGTRCK